MDYIVKYKKYKKKYLKHNKQYGGALGTCSICTEDNIELENNSIFSCEVHKFCMSCTLRLSLYRNISQNNIKCPQCRAGINKQNYREFTNKVSNIIENYSSSNRLTISMPLSMSSSMPSSMPSLMPIYRGIYNTITGRTLTSSDENQQNFIFGISGNTFYSILIMPCIIFLIEMFLIRITDNPNIGSGIFISRNFDSYVYGPIIVSYQFYPFLGNFILPIIRDTEMTQRTQRTQRTQQTQRTQSREINYSSLINNTLQNVVRNGIILFSIDRFPIIIRIIYNITCEQQEEYISSILNRVYDILGNRRFLRGGTYNKKNIKEYIFNFKEKDISLLLNNLKKDKEIISLNNKLKETKKGILCKIEFENIEEKYFNRIIKYNKEITIL